jgi:Ras GTPase-activating-like protein IQGAP2/3
MYINVALHYLRPKQALYARETFLEIVREVVDAIDLDLEPDPCQVCVLNYW